MNDSDVFKMMMQQIPFNVYTFNQRGHINKDLFSTLEIHSCIATYKEHFPYLSCTRYIFLVVTIKGEYLLIVTALSEDGLLSGGYILVIENNIEDLFLGLSNVSSTYGFQFNVKAVKEKLIIEGSKELDTMMSKDFQDV